MSDLTHVLHELDLGVTRVAIWNDGDVTIERDSSTSISMTPYEVTRMVAFILEHNPPTAASTNVMTVGYVEGDAETSLGLQCPYCKRMNVWPLESLEARGVFVPYCPGGDCEDLHAATL